MAQQLNHLASDSQMFEKTFKGIDGNLPKDTGCSSKVKCAGLMCQLAFLS